MSATSQEIKAVDKQVQALKLRQAGVSYDEIAKSLGYRSGSGAYQAVKSALRKTLREPAEDLRGIELARLDAALFAIWPMVKKGDLFAIDRFIKICERRSKLLGLDARQEIAVDAQVIAGSIDDIRARRWEQVSGQIAGLLDSDISSDTGG